KFANVHGWLQDHPDFYVWKHNQRDRAAVKFNHSVHLAKEGVRGADGKPVVLECAYCHQPDDRGRYMKQINYEQHCAVCHPLAVQVVANKEDKLGDAIREFAAQPAPHKAPLVVRAALRERFTRFVQEHPSVRSGGSVVAPEQPLPGRRRAQPVTREEWTWVDAQLQTAERALFAGPGGCTKCHPGREDLDPQGLPAYRQTEIPKTWLKHSVFSHRSHQMVLCLDCHGHAPTSKETSDILLPNVNTCKRCHQPQRGARSDCAMCHTYHDR